MKKLLLLVLATGLSTTLFSQTGEIKGTVVDSLTNEPIPFANVYVEYGESIKGTTSDFDGKFTIKPLKSGTYNVFVSHVEFGKKQINGVSVSSDKIAFTGKILINPNNSLKTFVVETVRYKLIDPESPGKETLRFTDMKNNPQRQDIGALIAMISPKVTSVNGELYFAGSRNGSTLYYVDGVKSTKQIKIPTSGLSSITVYTGGVPAKYGDCTGGIVVMETKSYFDLYNEWKANQ